jgi:hypothetical protein
MLSYEMVIPVPKKLHQTHSTLYFVHAFFISLTNREHIARKGMPFNRVEYTARLGFLIALVGKRTSLTQTPSTQ